jgi:DNA-binding IclR family transcriptional regulator
MGRAGIEPATLGLVSRRRAAARKDGRAAVVSDNERYVRCGAVPVRSQNDTKCPLAGCFEPSTAHFALHNDAETA